MSGSTEIEWTDTTWQVTTGCARVSPECGDLRGGCYAERMAWRLSHNPATPQYQGTVRMTDHGPRWTGVVRPFADDLAAPLAWKKPRRVFVDSMSDLFHDDVPDEFIAAVFGIMAVTPQHTFQVLTKRAERLPRFFEWLRGDLRVNKIGAIGDHAHTVAKLGNRYTDVFHRAYHDNTAGNPSWPLQNVWLGVSCGTRKHGLPRLEHLRRTPAAVRFVSFEPLLEDLGPVNLDGIAWAITGAESGIGARGMDEAWVRSLRDQCAAQGTAFFYKQRLDGRRKVSLPLLDGVRHDAMPQVSP